MALPLAEHRRGRYIVPAPRIYDKPQHHRLFTRYQDFSRELLSFFQLVVLLSYEQ